MTRKYPAIGCYLDHGARNIDELNADIVSEAKGFGMSALEEHNPDECDESEYLEWSAEEAETWLNDNVSVPYAYWGNDGYAGAFGLWPAIESLEEDCRAGEVLKVSDLSEIPENYAGLVMHVNDHGNVTLYETSAGEFSEIWSCV